MFLQKTCENAACQKRLEKLVKICVNQKDLNKSIQGKRHQAIYLRVERLKVQVIIAKVVKVTDFILLISMYISKYVLSIL